MTRVTPGSRVREAIVLASSAASAGVVCIFQLRGDHDLTHARESCQSDHPPAVPVPPPRAARCVPARAARPIDGARAARPAPPSVASGVSRRPSATRRTTYGCSVRRPSASSWAIASSWRPAAATARWRLADSALSTRFRSPRSARETWRASSSSNAPAAPIRRRNVPTDSALFQVTTPRPRRIRHDAGRPNASSLPGERRGARRPERRTRDGCDRRQG